MALPTPPWRFAFQLRFARCGLTGREWPGLHGTIPRVQLAFVVQIGGFQRAGRDIKHPLRHCHLIPARNPPSGNNLPFHMQHSAFVVPGCAFVS